MNINFTFIIQLFHFLLAYVILERFLLRPAVGIVQQEKNTLADAGIRIAMAQEILEKQKNTVIVRWRNFQHSTTADIPKLSVARTAFESQNKQIGVMPVFDKHTMVPQIKQFIVSKVSDAA